MKALAVDSANTKIFISAKNDDKIVTLIFDIGMRQSETLLPAIAYTLKKVEVEAKDLNYTALCKGPGSFTGLRLGFAALKALQLAHNVPIYAVPTLKVYATPFSELPQTVISVIDAKKDKFYAATYKAGKCIMDAGDYEIVDLIELIKTDIFICGPDAEKFKGIVKPLLPNFSVISAKGEIPSTESLFSLAEEMIKNNEPPLQEYEGPEYLRASEAEENLKK